MSPKGFKCLPFPVDMLFSPHIGHHVSTACQANSKSENDDFSESSSLTVLMAEVLPQAEGTLPFFHFFFFIYPNCRKSYVLPCLKWICK